MLQVSAHLEHWTCFARDAAEQNYAENFTQSLALVSQILGNADCRMLLSTYARHLLGSLGRADGRALEYVLGSADTGDRPLATRGVNIQGIQ